MRTSKLASFTAGALCVVVLGSGTAVAATGGKFILGRSNSATTTTTLSNTKGTALSLKAPSTKAPLAVSNGRKVTNLNADSLDGYDYTRFARVGGKTGSIRAQGVGADLDQDGTTDTIFAESDCPAGTQITGGGYSNFTTTGTVFGADTLDAPNHGYIVGVSIDPTAGEDPINVSSTAICYNPIGRVVGAAKQPSRATVLSHVSPAMRHALAAKAAARN